MVGFKPGVMAEGEDKAKDVENKTEVEAARLLDVRHLAKSRLKETVCRAGDQMRPR